MAGQWEGSPLDRGPPDLRRGGPACPSVRPLTPPLRSRVVGPCLLLLSGSFSKGQTLPSTPISRLVTAEVMQPECDSGGDPAVRGASTL